jgi:hypothetical protein
MLEFVLNLGRRLSEKLPTMYLGYEEVWKLNELKWIKDTVIIIVYRINALY